MDITVDDAAALITRLVAVPSINPALRRAGAPAEWFGEAAVAASVADWLHDAGIAAELVQVAEGRPNVVARHARAGRPRMIWEGHLDTVQVEGMADPFRARREGSRLYGRGTVDDKGCLAMFMLALRALARSGDGADVTFLAAVDEEVTFAGVRHHIATHDPYDLGIAGEPTGLRVVSACKGVIRFHVEVEGRGAHSSKPEEGIDAIAAAADLLQHLRAHMAGGAAVHPLLGRRSLTCTVLEAGDGPNTVAARARLTFDFRTLPDQTGAAAWAEIAAVVEAFAATRGDGAHVVVRPPFIDSVSMEVPADALAVRALGDVLAAAGRDGRPIGVPFGSDASKLTRAGTPCVIFGPGDIEQAHAIDEFVDLDEVVAGANVLVDLARRL